MWLPSFHPLGILTLTIVLLLVILSFCGFIRCDDKGDLATTPSMATQPSPVYQNPSSIVPDESTNLFIEAASILKKDYLDYSQEDIKHVIDLLERASSMGHSVAKKTLADLFVFGIGQSKIDFTRARQFYEQLKSEGNKVAGSSQTMLGFLHWEGLGGADQSAEKSLVYHTFAARIGDKASHLVLAHRFLTGLTVPRSCMSARYHLLRAAEPIIEFLKTHPRKQVHEPPRPRLLTDDAAIDAGLTGRLKKWLGLPIGLKGPEFLGPKEPHSQQDAIEFYRYSQKGVQDDGNTLAILGQLYYYGTGDLEPSDKEAFKLFERASEQGIKDAHHAHQFLMLLMCLGSSTGTAYLGLMLMRGEGVTQADYRRAYTCFRTAIKLGKSPLALNGMGILSWKGWDIDQDLNEALKLFRQAAELGHAEAHYNAAMVLLEMDSEGNKDLVFQSLLLALQAGYPLAMYEVARRFLVTPNTCSLAVFLLKSLVEKWDVSRRMFDHALKAYASGDLLASLIRYLYLAEQGYVVAMRNAAFILEHHGQDPGDRYRAFVNWSRAASQGDTVARIKTGDYLFYDSADMVLAAAAYHRACETGNRTYSAQANFNMGYMYHHGLGVPQDYWMAQRYYYTTMLAHPAAYWPIRVCLYWLEWTFADKGRLFWSSSCGFGILTAIVACIVGSYLFISRLISSKRRRDLLEMITVEPENRFEVDSAPRPDNDQPQQQE